MGIHGLWKALDGHRDKKAKADPILRGRRLGVDGNYLLHQKFMRFCSASLLVGDTKKLTKALTSWIRATSKRFDCEVVLVFDGADLPAKNEEAARRHRARTRLQVAAAELLAYAKHPSMTAGKPQKQASQPASHQQSPADADADLNEDEDEGDDVVMGSGEEIDITALTADDLMKQAAALYKNGISLEPAFIADAVAAVRKARVCPPPIVAPMEGEAQLGYLSRHGLIDVIYTGDSDIFVYDPAAVVIQDINKDRVDLVCGPGDKWPEDVLGTSPNSYETFVLGCALAGCDYVGGERAITSTAGEVAGLPSAQAAFEHLLGTKYAKLVKSGELPSALYAFLRHPVYDPRRQCLVSAADDRIITGAHFTSPPPAGATRPLPVQEGIVGILPSDCVAMCMPSDAAQVWRDRGASAAEVESRFRDFADDRASRSPYDGKFSCDLCASHIEGGAIPFEAHLSSTYHRALTTLSKLRATLGPPLSAIVLPSGEVAPSWWGGCGPACGNSPVVAGAANAEETLPRPPKFYRDGQLRWDEIAEGPVYLADKSTGSDAHNAERRAVTRRPVQRTHASDAVVVRGFLENVKDGFGFVFIPGLKSKVDPSSKALVGYSVGGGRGGVRVFVPRSNVSGMVTWAAKTPVTVSLVQNPKRPAEWMVYWAEPCSS